MDKLFLIEVLVEKVGFPNESQSIPRSQIVFGITFGNVMSMEIRADKLTGVDTGGGKGGKGEIVFNSGNSYLFPCRPEVLADALKMYTLDITLLSKSEPLPIGSLRIPWDKDFTNVVHFVATSDEDTFEAAMLQGFYTLEDTNESPICQIELLARLTCFGTSIRTHFQIQREEMSRKFLFKTGQANTVFQCQKYGIGTSDEMVPIGPLYAMPDLEIRREGSLDPVFIAYSASRTSTFNMRGADSSFAFMDTAAADTLSLIVRPDETAFINVKEFKIHSTEPTQELTPEKINNLLCNDPNCPGVKKFKELGLGPLATEKGHGAKYEPLDISLDHGLSHTYGILENYGPYGVFRKPKNLHEPIKKLLKGSNASCTCKVHTQNNVIGEEHCSPLRLNGGSPMAMEKELFPAPMAVSKDLMESLERYLNASKQAIGLSRQATCPYAGNIVYE